jgi:hypothetical protein
LLLRYLLEHFGLVGDLLFNFILLR